MIGFWFSSRKLSNDDKKAATNRMDRAKPCDFNTLDFEPSLRFTSSHNRRIKTGETVEPPTRKAQKDGKLLRRIALVKARASCKPNVSRVAGD